MISDKNQSMISDKNQNQVISKIIKHYVCKYLLTRVIGSHIFFESHTFHRTSQLQTLLATGTDTSMVTIEWALSLLLNHPSTLTKLRTELDLAIGEHQLLSESNLPNLPFLHCIINETLRLHPPAPIIPAHESSKDCHVGRFFVPCGTMLLVNAGAIQRDPEVWVDPTSFRPERFMEREGYGCNFVPFGVGRRRCPGEGLAMRVVGLGLGALIQCFEWEAEEGVDLKEEAGLVVRKARPLEAFCRPRGVLKRLNMY